MTSAKAPASRKPGGMSNGKAVRNRGQQTRQAILDKATEILIEQGSRQGNRDPDRTGIRCPGAS
jgi:hypothetical protein